MGSNAQLLIVLITICYLNAVPVSLQNCKGQVLRQGPEDAPVLGVVVYSNARIADSSVALPLSHYLFAELNLTASRRTYAASCILRASFERVARLSFLPKPFAVSIMEFHDIPRLKVQDHGIALFIVGPAAVPALSGHLSRFGHESNNHEQPGCADSR